MSTWQHIAQEDPGEPFGDEHSLNGRPYPSWWPSPCKYRKQNLLEALYGFPYLSWWELERGAYWPKFPKIDFDSFRAPTQHLLETMPTLNQLGDTWRLKSTKRDDNTLWMLDLCNFWDADPNKSNYKLWENYLYENCLPQLQFFGVPFKSIENTKIFKEDSLFFKKPLNYCPGKFVLMVVFSLSIVITHKLKNDPDAPFRYWPAVGNESSYRTGLDMPWLQDKTDFQFPIISWLKTRDENQIINTAARIRGSKTPHFWEKWDYNPKNLVSDYSLSALLCFLKFYKTDGFKTHTEQEIYYGFSGPFRWLYIDMIKKMKANKMLSSSLSAINGPNKIYSNPYSNIKSSCDWMLWSLAIIWMDLKNWEPYYQEFLKAPLNEEHYRGAITTHFRQIQEEKDATKANQDFNKDLNEKWKEHSTEGQPPRPIIGAPFQIASKILSNFLIDFQYAWRKTAEYHFLGIDAPNWPPAFPALPFDDSNSLDAKIYDFIAQNPPRKLKVPQVDNIYFQRLSWKWEAVYKQQYIYYLEWVYSNVRAQDNPNYSPPGVQLKNNQGEYIHIQNAGNSVAIINSFPDLIMVPPDTGFTLSKAVSFLVIPIDQAAMFIWGDDWTAFLDNLGQKIWKKIQESLKELWTFVKENAPALGAGLALVALVGLGGLLGVTFLEAKVSKAA